MGSLISYIQGGGPSEDLFLDFESALLPLCRRRRPHHLPPSLPASLPVFRGTLPLLFFSATAALDPRPSRAAAVGARQRTGAASARRLPREAPGRGAGPLVVLFIFLCA